MCLNWSSNVMNDYHKHIFYSKASTLLISRMSHDCTCKLIRSFSCTVLTLRSEQYLFIWIWLEGNLQILSFFYIFDFIEELHWIYTSFPTLLNRVQWKLGWEVLGRKSSRRLNWMRLKTAFVCLGNLQDCFLSDHCKFTALFWARICNQT